MSAMINFVFISLLAISAKVDVIPLPFILTSTVQLGQADDHGCTIVLFSWYFGGEHTRHTPPCIVD